MDIFPIETERLVIRRFRKDDAAAFHSWRDDEEVARYTLWDYPFSLERSETFCEKMAAIEPFPEGEWFQLVIEEKSTGKAVGDIGLGIKIDGNPDIGIGYSLHRSAHGNRYVGEALKDVIPAVAKAVGVKQAKAETDARNIASEKVLLKLGFEQSELHERASFVKGEWCDEYYYVLNIQE